METEPKPTPGSHDDSKVKKRQSTEIKLTEEELYQLTEIKILREIEDKFFDLLKRKARVWGVAIAIAAAIAGVFGMTSFWSELHRFIQSTAKSEVDDRMSSEFPRLESRIDETFKSGILAKDASDKGLNAMNDMVERFTNIEATLDALKSRTSTAQTNGQILAKEIDEQRTNLARLEEIVNGWFKNSKTETFDFKQTNTFGICAMGPDGNGALVCFLLSSIPVESSLRLQYSIYSQPPGSYWNTRNLVFFNWGQDFQRLQSEPVYVSYVSSPTGTNLFHDLQLTNGVLYANNVPILSTNILQYRDGKLQTIAKP
jgi:hypothetical protein